MSSQIMCRCKTCKKNTIGIKTGMSAGGWFAHLVMVVLTGLLWLIVLVPCALFISTTRCSVCGNVASKL